MGEAKRRGVEGASYGARRSYDVVADGKFYVAVNGAMKASAERPAGEREEIDLLAGDVTALGATPSAMADGTDDFRAEEDDESLERSTLALSDRIAEAVKTAETHSVLLFAGSGDDEAIVDVDPQRFSTGWMRGLGPAGAGRCFRRRGTRSASLNPITGTYLSVESGDSEKASIVDAVRFLADKGVPTPAGLLFLGDPLCLQIATMIRQSVVEHRDRGLAKIGDGLSSRLRAEAEAILANARSRHCGRAASADVIASVHLLEKGTAMIATLGDRPAMPFLTVAAQIARRAHAAMPPDGGAADDLAKAMGVPLLRFVGRAHGAASDWSGFDAIATAFGWEPSADASTILVNGAERPALRGFAARVGSNHRGLELQGGGMASAFESEGSRYIAIAATQSGDANVIAWRV